MVKLTLETIPVKVVQVTNIHGEKKVGVMLDLSYYLGKDANPDQKVQKFRDLYLGTVIKARRLFYGKSKDQIRKYQGLSSSTYWMLGHILGKFNSEIRSEFVITNYAVALERDFGLNRKYLQDLLRFAKLFKQNEILDSIPMSYYRTLLKKRSQLVECGIFEKEKKRLARMGKQNKLTGRESYNRELTHLVKISLSKKEVQKT